MVRLLGIVMVCILLFGLRASAGDNPSIVVNAPKQAVAGTSFTVKVEISKGEIEGIARYQLNLPQGVSIEPGDCANADFEFLNQSLKLMWYRIPKTTSLSFSFKVVTHSNIAGLLSVDGSFVYITPANVTKNITAQPVKVEITQSPSVDPKTVVDINNFKPGKVSEEKTLTFVPATQQLESVKMESKALRQGPAYDAKTNTYLVSIMLDKGSATKYAKLEEDIPAGYTAEPIETKGGVFDFKNGKVKFLWLELPAQSRYLVSYRLKPKAAKSEAVKIGITGYFAFINGDNTEIHEVAQLHANSSLNLNSGELGALQNQGAARDIPIKYVGIAKQASVKETKASVKQAEISKEDATSSSKNAEAVKSTKPQEHAKTAVAKTSAKTATGVTFKVQLAAVSRDADKKGADAQFAELGKIGKEEVNGLIRYLIGPYESIEEAQAAKENAKSKGAAGAFVAAYNSKGVRIPMSEAFESEKK